MCKMCLSLLALGWLATASCANGSNQPAGDDDDDGAARIDAGGGGGQCSFCADGEECCNGFCTNTRQNESHCGGCGNVCDVNVSNGCMNGQCLCNFGPACAAGSTCCDTGCKNLAADPNNCGACGRPCEAGETCVDGQCVCAAAGVECAGTQSCCPTGCVDTSSDAANCGTCGMACEAGDVCAGGSCNCAFTCPPALPLLSKVVCCGDGCYDICNDALHCGGCAETACPGGCTIGGCLDEAGNSITPPDLLNCFFSFPM